MKRPTLKLPPRAGEPARAKPPTSRQRRALHGRKPAAVAPIPTSAASRNARTATPPRNVAPPRTAKPQRAPRGEAVAPTIKSARIATTTTRPPGADNPRLSKRMSELGFCSRREADDWIENGWVKVDGAVVSTLGTRVSPDARIEIDPAARRHQHEQVTILLNKPVGYVSGQAEGGYRPASVLIRPENRWPEDRTPVTFKPSHLRGLAPAGRLDIDSTGLIVFTQDGRVARRLIGHDSEVEKEYLVRVEGTLSPEALQRLQHGLELDGVMLKPAKVSWQNEHQLRFVLREGRKRQIRRMCELVGLKVTGLKRVRTGSVVLGKLPAGQWRYLRPDEKF